MPHRFKGITSICTRADRKRYTAQMKEFQVGHINLGRQCISEISTPTLTIWKEASLGTSRKPSPSPARGSSFQTISILDPLQGFYGPVWVRALEEEKERLDSIPAIAPEGIRAVTQTITSASDNATFDDRTIEDYLNINSTLHKRCYHSYA
jgi:hypothetical protein